MQAGFQVLRIDMRGHGGSDPALGDHYSMQELAGDVASVLDALSLSRVHYIGLSIGGMIGQAFAIDHQDKLISIMWCDTLTNAQRVLDRSGLREFASRVLFQMSVTDSSSLIDSPRQVIGKTPAVLQAPGCFGMRGDRLIKTDIQRRARTEERSRRRT